MEISFRYDWSISTEHNQVRINMILIFEDNQSLINNRPGYNYFITKSCSPQYYVIQFQLDYNYVIHIYNLFWAGLDPKKQVNTDIPAYKARKFFGKHQKYSSGRIVLHPKQRFSCSFCDKIVVTCLNLFSKWYEMRKDKKT